MEHSAASPSRAVSPRGSSNSKSPPREKRKLESFVAESGETWEFTERPVKKPRSSGPGSNTSTIASGSPPLTQRPSISATSPTRGKRSRDPSDQDADAQPPSPKRRMTSVNDLDGDHAAALRRADWLRSSRSRRQGVAASRSRSLSQSGLLGEFNAGSGAGQSAGYVELEELEELPDYESDEDLGQHADNTPEQVASFGVPAMTLPPASSFQEGQESRMPAVASIETDSGKKHPTGLLSGHLWTPDWSLKVALRVPGSESEVDSPQLLRSKFGGFAQAAATIRHRSEAQQQLAREPGYTSTSASGPGLVAAVGTATTSTKGRLSPIRESSAEIVQAIKLQSTPSPVSESHDINATIPPMFELSPSAEQLPTMSPASLQSGIIDEPSQQLLSELENYASNSKNFYESQVKPEKVKVEDEYSTIVSAHETKSTETRAAANAANPTIPHQPQVAASGASIVNSRAVITPILPTLEYTEEELQHMMAIHATEGPGEDDFEVLRMLCDEYDGRMEIDDPETFNTAQDRIRKQRDEDIKKAKELSKARQKVEKHRSHIDEAPDEELTDEHESEEADDDDIYTDHLLASSPDGLQIEKLRLQTAVEHWKSPWPKPEDLPSNHWAQEARTFATNQAKASNAAEKHYWASRSIQAESYAKGEFKSARISNIHISLSLVDWKKSITTSEEEAAAFAEEISQITLTEEDPEAASKARLAAFLSQLPPDLDQSVTDILNKTNPRQAIVKSQEGNDLSRGDFATLLDSPNYRTGEPEGWLNDNIVNAFFTALCNGMNDKAGHTKGKVPPYTSYATGWYGSVVQKGVTAIERWSRRKGIKGDKLLQCKRIFFPVNPGNHWSLLVICPDIHTIEYLDSLDGGHSVNRKSAKYIKLGREWLKMELGDKYVEAEWNPVDRRSAIQNNGSDCGVFTCLNGLTSALELSNPAEEFGPEQIPHARRAMVSMLKLGGFSQHFEL
ncbi:cysteine proteinase [Aureobasidium subglaciale]|nr:cysteine proteinase [Aureobasidium subglaciale]KAI5221827.1 cysteine proteinase [Aureobasidium subglaciale]KAI5225814.1 cysteine proteinase [Aureobasidium subglaciale]KAI5261573.1 cysteine proteinase [Aureobasidium subglaciale]